MNIQADQLKVAVENVLIALAEHVKPKPGSRAGNTSATAASGATISLKSILDDFEYACDQMEFALRQNCSAEPDLADAAAALAVTEDTPVQQSKPAISTPQSSTMTVEPAIVATAPTAVSLSNIDQSNASSIISGATTTTKFEDEYMNIPQEHFEDVINEFFQYSNYSGEV